RPGVTVGLQVLEGTGSRLFPTGEVDIRDRNGLKTSANGTYGQPEAHYVRLLGE
ncbi:MAG: Crp/Fnr family transcriptional regulator, partial [Mesorhizobium sp.]